MEGSESKSLFNPVRFVNEARIFPNSTEHVRFVRASLEEPGVVEFEKPEKSFLNMQVKRNKQLV